MLQGDRDQRKHGIRFVADCLQIHNSKTAEPKLLMIVLSHNQIPCKAIAFHNSEDKKITGFERGTELPVECFAVAHRHQSIQTPAKHAPQRIESLIETRQ